MSNDEDKPHDFEREFAEAMAEERARREFVGCLTTILSIAWALLVGYCAYKLTS